MDTDLPMRSAGNHKRSWLPWACLGCGCLIVVLCVLLVAFYILCLPAIISPA